MDGSDPRHKRLRYIDDLRPLDDYYVSLFNRFLGQDAYDWSTATTGSTDGPISTHDIDISPPPSPSSSPSSPTDYIEYPPLPPPLPPPPQHHHQQQQLLQQHHHHHHHHQQQQLQQEVEKQQQRPQKPQQSQVQPLPTERETCTAQLQQQQQHHQQQQHQQQQQQQQQQQHQQQQQQQRQRQQAQALTSSSTTSSSSSQPHPQPQPPQPPQPHPQQPQKPSQPPPSSASSSSSSHPASVPPSPRHQYPETNDYDDVYDDQEEIDDNDDHDDDDNHGQENNDDDDESAAYAASSVVVTATVHTNNTGNDYTNNTASGGEYPDPIQSHPTRFEPITHHHHHQHYNNNNSASSTEQFHSKPIPSATESTPSQHSHTNTHSRSHPSAKASPQVQQIQQQQQQQQQHHHKQQQQQHFQKGSPPPPLHHDEQIHYDPIITSQPVNQIQSQPPQPPPQSSSSSSYQNQNKYSAHQNQTSTNYQQSRHYQESSHQNTPQVDQNQQTSHRSIKQTSRHNQDHQNQTSIYSNQNSTRQNQSPVNNQNHQQHHHHKQQQQQQQHHNHQLSQQSNPSTRSTTTTNNTSKTQQAQQPTHKPPATLHQHTSKQPDQFTAASSEPTFISLEQVPQIPSPVYNNNNNINNDIHSRNNNSSRSRSNSIINNSTKQQNHHQTSSQGHHEKFKEPTRISKNLNQSSRQTATPTFSSAPPTTSLTPPSSSKMNHTDTKNMNGSPVLTNHVGGPADSSINHRKFSKADSTDDNKREGPISIPSDIESRSKTLTKEQVRDKISQAVTCLKSMDEYHHGDAMKIQKAIGDVYWDYSAQRVEIGDLLSTLGYADITVTMLKQMNSLGIFKNDDIWFPTYYTYNTCWNYSDASDTLARSLAESGAVKLMTLNLGHKPYIDNMHSKNVYYVLKASLSTLHNIARCTGVKHHFKEIKTAEVIMPLISANDEFLKSIAMLTLAYIVEEEENAKLIDETNTIKNIVLWIQKALENKQKRRFRGFTPWELTQGLAKLAVNDGNKSRIVEEGALQSFHTMLRHTDPKEQATSAECIWNLSFDKTVRQAIVDHEDLVPALEDLKDSENQTVRKNVNGALWMIKGDNDPSASVSRPHSAEATKNHIFISYSWNEKELVQKIHASLQSLGFRIWVDWEQMGGSTLQAMAEAVENSAVVLVCMSERYKQSPNCRTEAEYTFQTRKDYIPLMMQRRYRPDGWLGAILGAKLFFDFSGKHPYEKSLQGLIKELRGRGKHSSNSIDEPDGSRDAAQGSITTTALSLVGSSPGTPSGARPSNGGLVSSGGSGGGGACAAMSNENVETWLVSKGLQRFTPTFSQIDGQLIWQLKKMRETAPEYYHNSLERQFGMTLIDVLRFNAALDSLH